MKSTEDPAQATQFPKSEPSRPVSRRDIIISGTATVGMMSATGVSTAATEDVSPESKGSSETCRLTITVTGLEVGGPLSDVCVTVGDEEKWTDESGRVSFEVEPGICDVNATKERWNSATKTIDMDGTDREIDLPMYIKKYNELTVVISDASRGTPVQKSTVSVTGYGEVHCDSEGTATIFLENGLEPTEHDLTVTADGYQNETRRVTMADDQRLRIEVVPK